MPNALSQLHEGMTHGGGEPLPRNMLEQMAQDIAIRRASQQGQLPSGLRGEEPGLQGGMELGSVAGIPISLTDLLPPDLGMNALAALGKVGAAKIGVPALAGIFAGKGAKTADIVALDLAQKMKAAGVAGEAEARLTQARMNMTPAERAASYPPSMFDVPVDQQIVRYGDGQAMSVPKNNAWLESEIRKQYSYVGKMPPAEEISRMADARRADLERHAAGKTINKSKSAQTKLAVNDYQDAINNAHKIKQLEFNPLPDDLIDSRNLHMIHQSNSYGGKPGSSYHIQMLNGEPVYVRTSDHWGEFGTKDVGGNGEDIFNSYQWNLPGEVRGKRQSGYIRLSDLNASPAINSNFVGIPNNGMQEGLLRASDPVTTQLAQNGAARGGINNAPIIPNSQPMSYDDLLSTAQKSVSDMMARNKR